MPKLLKFDDTTLSSSQRSELFSRSTFHEEDVMDVRPNCTIRILRTVIKLLDNRVNRSDRNAISADFERPPLRDRKTTSYTNVSGPLMCNQSVVNRIVYPFERLDTVAKFNISWERYLRSYCMFHFRIRISSISKKQRQN